MTNTGGDHLLQWGLHGVLTPSGGMIGETSDTTTFVRRIEIVQNLGDMKTGIIGKSEGCRMSLAGMRGESGPTGIGGMKGTTTGQAMNIRARLDGNDDIIDIIPPGGKAVRKSKMGRSVRPE